VLKYIGMLLYIYVGFTVLFFLTLFEGLFSRCKKKKNDFKINSKILLGNVLIAAIQNLTGFVLIFYSFEILNLKLVEFEGVSKVLIFILCFLTVDFLYYVQHLIHHKSKILWKIHQVHHSSLLFNLSTGYRVSWLAFLTKPIFFSPAVILGFHPVAVISCIYIIQLYNHFMHIDKDISFRFLGSFFVSPNDHRVHHSCYEHHIDKNMGGVLNIWDKLFGTYSASSLSKIKYGTTEQKHIESPFLINFNAWFDDKNTKF